MIGLATILDLAIFLAVAVIFVLMARRILRWRLPRMSPLKLMLVGLAGAVGILVLFLAVLAIVSHMDWFRCQSSGGAILVVAGDLPSTNEPLTEVEKEAELRRLCADNAETCGATRLHETQRINEICAPYR
jgi:hypothetical protein